MASNKQHRYLKHPEDSPTRRIRALSSHDEDGMLSVKYQNAPPFIKVEQSPFLPGWDVIIHQGCMTRKDYFISLIRARQYAANESRIRNIHYYED